MPSDQAIIDQLSSAFAAASRPEHFTDYKHCCECAEHDQTLRSRSPETLGLADVGNPGWDPICFITPQGFRYYLPALFGLALAVCDGAGRPVYLDQLLFHLIFDGEKNARVEACTDPERKAVVAALWHIAAMQNAGADEAELMRAIEIWSLPGQVEA